MRTYSFIGLMSLLFSFNSSAVKEGEELRNDPDFRHTYATQLAVERAEGRKEGVAEGMRRKTIETAKSMVEVGMEDALILQITQLPPEELEQIKRENALSALAEGEVHPPLQPSS